MQLNYGKLTEVEFRYTNLIDARINNAQLKLVDLTNAGLIGAELNHSRLETVNFEGVSYFDLISFYGAGVKDTDFSKSDLSKSQINNMFLDGSVRLPSTLNLAENLERETLSWLAFDDEWKAWQKTLPPRDND